MDLQIEITDRLNNREVGPTLYFAWREDVPLTLETLIRERVRLEVEKQARSAADDLPEYHPLIAWQREPEFTEDLETRIVTAQEVALDGFRSNAFFVIVDGLQVMQLEAEFALTPQSTVNFIRLIPLKGG